MPAPSRHPVLALAHGARRWIVASTALRLAVLASYLGQGFLLAAVLAGVVGGAGLGEQATALVGLVALLVVRAGLLWLVEVTTARTGEATTRHVRRRAFTHLAAVGPVGLGSARTGSIRESLVAGVDALDRYLATFLPSLVAAIAAPVVVVVVLATLDVPLALLVAAVTVTTLLLPSLWNRALRARGGDRMDSYVEMGARFLDTVSGIVTLKGLDAVRRRRAALAEDSETLIARWNREMAVALVPGGIYQAGIVGGAVLVGIVAGVRTASGGLAVGTLFLALFLTREALRPIGVLAGAFHTTYDAADAAGRIRALLDTPPPVRTTAGRPDGPVGGAVSMENVTFGYDPGRPVIRDLSLDVPAGATVALVGASGVGKSTVASLLLRFADPQRGTVRVGGADLAGLDRDAVPVSLVAQDTYLFGDTVRANLRLARPDADDADLERATRAAAIHEELAALPDGYDTVLGERGAGLSGGQRQRLSLARALLADRPVLVLDEATSGVDAVTEAAVVAALEVERGRRTVIVIAHRLSTVRGADRIVVLDDGATVESGTHQELIDLNGRYADLVRAQTDTHARTGEVLTR